MNYIRKAFIKVGFGVLSEIFSLQKKQLLHMDGISPWICKKAGGGSESDLHGKVTCVVGKAS